MEPLVEINDVIDPATSFYTTNINNSVKLRIPREGKAIETIKPISVPTLLQRTAINYPTFPALYWKSSVTNNWECFSYREYLQQVRTCAKAFLHLGLEKQHSVAILGFNSPEWFISSLAAIFAGGISLGIYITNSKDVIAHCARMGKTCIFVIQDGIYLEKIKQIKNELPHLKAIVQYEGVPSDPDVLSWKQLMEIGNNQNSDRLDSGLKNVVVNQCCNLIFTSGTVGFPKAVMLTHDNLTWNALNNCEIFDPEMAKERFVSYLPLAHIAAQIIDVYSAITLAGSVYFADKNAFNGSLINTLLEVRPTYFLGVPRVWEKMYEKIQNVEQSSHSFKKAILKWARYQGMEHNLNKINGIQSSTWKYAIAKSLVFNRIKQALGFDCIKCCITGAAPLSTKIKEYFLSIDLIIHEVYGMSETCGTHTIAMGNIYNMESVGTEISGSKTKILNSCTNENGELCVYGRHIYMGYLEDPEETNKALDKDGWLHTGDIGYIDDQRLVYITGRTKELLITAGGENIPPILIEQNVKSELPYLSNVILIGDKKKYLSILLTLKTKINENDGTPSDQLTDEVQQWLTDLGCPAKTVTQVLNNGPDKKLLQAIQEKIDKANKKAISKPQTIQKFAILPSDFSVTTGEFGPTMKLRRKVVINKYADVIEKLYA